MKSHLGREGARWLGPTFMLIVATLAAAPAAPQDPTPRYVAGTARVHGRVVAADTGAAIRSATVTLSSVGTGSWVATTGDEGDFDVRELPAGRFSIRITKAGFVPTLFALHARAALGSELKAGQELDRGVLKLPRGGVIVGRILDDHGEPVADAVVNAWRVEYTSPGIRRLASAGSGQANDLGDFRLYGLRPGQYYVSAGFRQFQISASEGAAAATQFLNAGRGPVWTFYPGTVLATDAQLISVSAGEETAGIGLRLLTMSLARVSGRVVDSQGRPAMNVVVMLNPARSDGAALFNANLVEVDAQGRFSLSNVPPGDYFVDVVSRARMEAVGTTGGVGLPSEGELPEFASHPLTVFGDVSDVLVQTGVGFEISGRILIDGTPAADAMLKHLQVNAIPLLSTQGISGVLLTAGAAIRPDGTFVVRGATGSRLIRVSGLPGIALQSVIARGMDVTDDGLDISNGNVSGVEIALTSKPTRVTGEVTDAAGVPVRDYVAIIFSEDNRRWTTPYSRYVVSQRPGADGRFSVSALPAGKFLGVAVASLEDGQWANPDNLERLREVATPFSLTDGETRSVTLVRK